MSVTLPTWVVLLLIFAAFLALCWWVDRRFLNPWSERLSDWLVRRHQQRRKP